jgi:hypothetical protein
MPSEPYEPVPAKAIDDLAKQLRPLVAGSDLALEELLALPEAKQLIAAWGVKHEVPVLAPRRKVAGWLVGSLIRRGLGDDAATEQD